MVASASPLLSELRISLPEIARLARVKRPVVTVWRGRSAGTGTPFPAPVARERGQEWFDTESVVTWLEETGRGNNREVRRDAAAFTTPGAGPVSGDDAQFYGLTALLCLSVVTGGALGIRTDEELLDLADEADPDDELLYREVAALGPRLVSLARHADMLADASYHAAAAFEMLLGERRRVKDVGGVLLSAAARDLIAGAAVAMADQAVLDTPTFVDVTPGGSDLAVDIAMRVEGRAVLVATPAGDDAASRLARRRVRVHGLPWSALRPDGQGGYEIPPGAIVVGQFPGTGAPMSDLQVLRALGAAALQTTAEHRVVVIGPATALADALSGPAERRERDDVLRTDRLRALVRLPAGLVPAHPRTHLALYCLGPKSQVTVPERQRISVGDLCNIALDDHVIDDLITDLVAAVDDSAGARGHGGRFLQPVLVRELRARLGNLVAGETGSPRTPDGAGLAVRISDAARRAAMPIPTVGLPAIQSRPAAHHGRPATTLGDAVAGEEIRVLPGHRIDPADVTGDGGVPLIGPDEVLGEAAVGRRRIRQLAFAARYPAGHYTEPGDVIFCTGPRPAAIVDAGGGSVVCYPARIARVVPGSARGLLPRVLAADIAAASGTSWRAWPIRRVGGDAIVALDRCLADIDAARSACAERIAQLDTLQRLLTDGAAAGVVGLGPPAGVDATGHDIPRSTGGGSTPSARPAAPSPKSRSPKVRSTKSPSTKGH